MTYQPPEVSNLIADIERATDHPMSIGFCVNDFVLTPAERVARDWAEDNGLIKIQYDSPSGYLIATVEKGHDQL